jgi:hypothetical protein
MEELKVWAGNNEVLFIELLLPVTNNYAFNDAESMLWPYMVRQLMLLTN